MRLTARQLEAGCYVAGGLLGLGLGVAVAAAVAVAPAAGVGLRPWSPPPTTARAAVPLLPAAPARPDGRPPRVALVGEDRPAPSPPDRTATAPTPSAAAATSPAPPSSEVTPTPAAPASEPLTPSPSPAPDDSVPQDSAGQDSGHQEDPPPVGGEGSGG